VSGTFVAKFCGGFNPKEVLGVFEMFRIANMPFCQNTKPPYITILEWSRNEQVEMTMAG
jgi:hypothetical protein